MINKLTVTEYEIILDTVYQVVLFFVQAYRPLIWFSGCDLVSVTSDLQAYVCVTDGWARV